MKNDEQARTKVRWDTAILLVTKGGVKILEPKIQAKAMLAKMVFRGCTPNKGPGKSLLDTE